MCCTIKNISTKSNRQELKRKLEKNTQTLTHTNVYLHIYLCATKWEEEGRMKYKKKKVKKKTSAWCQL